jgi:hypothetical protein
LHLSLCWKRRMVQTCIVAWPMLAAWYATLGLRCVEIEYATLGLRCVDWIRNAGIALCQLINRFDQSVRSIDSIDRLDRSVQLIDVRLFVCCLAHFDWSIQLTVLINRFNQSVQSIDSINWLDRSVPSVEVWLLAWWLGSVASY